MEPLYQISQSFIVRKNVSLLGFWGHHYDYNKKLSWSVKLLRVSNKNNLVCLPQNYGNGLKCRSVHSIQKGISIDTTKVNCGHFIKISDVNQHLATDFSLKFWNFPTFPDFKPPQYLVFIKRSHILNQNWRFV